jgi:hypothetical protein
MYGFESFISPPVAQPIPQVIATAFNFLSKTTEINRLKLCNLIGKPITMNLYFNPQERELHKLISQTDNGKKVHDVVVDFDGEVLIDPELEQPGLDLNKFKVHVRLSDRLIRALNVQSNHLRSLFNNLQQAWNDKYNLISYSVFDIQ